MGQMREIVMGLRSNTFFLHAKHILQLDDQKPETPVPKGHIAVYVEEMNGGGKHRFVVPLWYLNHPMFQQLLNQAEEEYGFDRPILGGLTIPCTRKAFLTVTSQLMH